MPHTRGSHCSVIHIRLALLSSHVRLDGVVCLLNAQVNLDDAVSGIPGGVATRFAVGHTSAGRGLEYGKAKHSFSPHKSGP